jgi:hypothetical protein
MTLPLTSTPPPSPKQSYVTVTSNVNKHGGLSRDYDVIRKQT